MARRTSVNQLLHPQRPINWDHPLNRGLVLEPAINAPLPGWTGSGALYDMVRGAKSPNDGTLNSGVTWSSGQYGWSLAFNGLTGIAAAPAVFQGGTWTFAGWFNTTSNSADQTIIALGRRGQTNSWTRLMVSSAGTLRTNIGDAVGTQQNVDSSNSVVAGAWHFGAVSVQGNGSPPGNIGGTVNIILDRTITSSVFVAYAFNAFDYTALGVLRYSSDLQFFGGSLGEWSVWSRALSVAELLAVRDQGSRLNPDRWNWQARRTYSAPAGGAAYSLSGSAGSFTLTGEALSLSAGRPLAASAGAFTLTGKSATMAAGRPLSAGAGAFILTGKALTPSVGRPLAASAGSFALTGKGATLARGKGLAGAAGSFALTGESLGAAIGRLLSGGVGSFTVGGQEAALAHGGIVVLPTVFVGSASYPYTLQVGPQNAAG